MITIYHVTNKEIACIEICQRNFHLAVLCIRNIVEEFSVSMEL